MIRIGQRLQQARLQKKLTLEEIAKATKIKTAFLAAIEKGDYKELPSAAYAQGFVRNYANYLGLPKAETTALFKRDFDEKKSLKVLPDGMVGAEGFSLQRVNFRKMIILGIVFVFVMGFVYFQYRAAFSPPPISLYSPKEGVRVSQETTVNGKTDRDATLTVNNEQVALNPEGEFTKSLSLFPGKATITVKSKNRNGKETIVQRTVTVE